MNALRIIGSGAHKVLCLHGWFGSAAGWGPWAEVLDTDRFTWAFMDYRGYGARREEEGAYTMAEISADAIAAADALDWPRFSMVGHSMGAMAMQRVMLDAPGRARKLVAVTPVAASGVPFDEPTWAFFSSAAQSAEARRGIIDITTGKRLTATWLTQMVRHSVTTSVPEAFGAYLVAWAKTDFSAELGRPELPLLALVGEHDPALGEAPTRATYLASYPNAQLEVLANAGHYPMFETPLAMAASIEGFLAAE
jgi:pimeloyl-ACP methyl ester carboxylesterase